MNTIDVPGLVSALKSRVDGEIRFSDGDRALYATDASNYRKVPLGVVVPYDVETLAEAVRVCAEFAAPITHRGGGTALAGQTTNRAVIIDASKYCDRFLALDLEKRLATVEPGIVLDEVQKRCRPHGLRFGPDPATHSHNCIGGMIGNNSAGPHSLVAGVTSHNVESLEVLTYDGLRMTVGRTSLDEENRLIAGGGRRGEVYTALKRLRERYAEEIRRVYPKIPRRVSGYNLDSLLPDESGHFHLARALVGSEGTCVTVLRATLNLIDDPPAKVVLAVGFDTVCHAADRVPEIRGFDPDAIEGVDERLADFMRKKHLHVEDLKLLPEGPSWLFVEFSGADRDEAAARARRLEDHLRGQAHVTGLKIVADEHQQERLWRVRESGLGATAWVPGQKHDTWPGWEDSAVAPERLGAYMRDLLKLFDRYGYHPSLYGHFGDGLIHCRVGFGLHTPQEVSRYRDFMVEAAHLVVRHGGTLSGEHGDGEARSELLPIMFGDELVRAFEEFKAIWDPRNRMNPKTVVHPDPIDRNLRLGPRFHRPEPEHVFAYPDDGGSFSRAALRCVGVGKCRRHEGGTMCPSYRATREEKHTTRGRARMLQEMLQGDPVRDGWRSEAVRDSLHLCLSCKGCKSDCPVNVDMATYKAEFLHHHYRGRLRPRVAYTMGLINMWARWLAPVWWAPNLATQMPVFGRLSRAVAGIAPQRPVPTFASPTFRRAFRPEPGRGRPPVVLWSDTFNNHFAPEPLFAAAEVLDAAGFDVRIPRGNLCCGRPYYEFGWLDAARRTLRRTMTGLRRELDAGAHVVGVEPSCISVFRDELPNLFPDDPEAKRLTARSMLLAEFLETVARFDPPRLSGRALVHGHCHHKAVIGMGCDAAQIHKSGLDARILDDGCCGMAGAFGYETDKYEVSVGIFDQGLGASVRAAPDDTLLIADGFSCRQQVEQLTGRRVYTLAEVWRDGLRRRTAHAPANQERASSAAE
ncbi:MAG TPA: FAD-binding and (Fe-S)-binding domain-containing protein [Azospirillum sp.]|nr:FAD-binding and (Fe-S)-binding domain-containing protein [Azospirillum sp.]